MRHATDKVPEATDAKRQTTDGCSQTTGESTKNKRAETFGLKVSPTERTELHASAAGAVRLIGLVWMLYDFAPLSPESATVTSVAPPGTAGGENRISPVTPFVANFATASPLPATCTAHREATNTQQGWQQRVKPRSQPVAPHVAVMLFVSGNPGSAEDMETRSNW